MTDDGSGGAMELAAHLLGRARHAVAFTGAGISVASGIPDFRSIGGLWERFRPAEYATVDAFIAHPDKVWQLFDAVGALLEQAAPNAAHLALRELDAMGVVEGVITQNIDGLHQAAGQRRVVEYHGSATRLHCLVCGSNYRPARRGLRGGPAPRCRCGNALKPSVVLFGEAIPRAAQAEAERLARSCDLMLVVGCSALVAPAADLPELAKEHGAQVLELNLERTSLSHGIADLYIEGPAERTLPALVAALHSLYGL